MFDLSSSASRRGGGIGHIASFLLVLDETHRCGRAHVYCLGLDPLVTHLAICDIVGILSANLPIVMDFVSEGPGVVPIVDRGPARQIQLVMRGLLARLAEQRLATISVIEMSILKEADSLGAELVVPLRFCTLVGALVLGLAAEATVTGFKVRARDVGLGELVEARIDSP